MRYHRWKVSKEQAGEIFVIDLPVQMQTKIVVIKKPIKNNDSLLEFDPIGGIGW